MRERDVFITSLHLVTITIFQEDGVGRGAGRVVVGYIRSSWWLRRDVGEDPLFKLGLENPDFWFLLQI